MRRDTVILIVALWAFTTSPILIRFSDLPSSDLVAGRLLVSLLLLAPFWLRTKGKSKFALFLDLRILTAGVMLGAHFILWTISLSYTSIASASVAVCIAPVFIVMIERWILKRTLKRDTVSGLGISLAGVFLLLADDLHIQKHGAYGISLALLGAFLSAVYLLIGENARKTHRLFDYCMPVYFIGMVMAFGFSAWQGRLPAQIVQVSGREWLIFLSLAILPTILGHTAYNYILRSFSASTLSIAALSEPFLATLFAMLIFREFPTPMGILGGAVTLLGVYWVLRGQSFAEPSEPQT